MKHTILLFICLFSCGTNPSKNSSYIINQIDYYVQQTDNNKSLVESIIEGVITDEKGEKDTGGFEYYELYDDNRKELYRIRDYETINDLYFERLFYFKKMKLVFDLMYSRFSLSMVLYIISLPSLTFAKLNL